VSVPEGLAWRRQVPEGAAWLERLPRLAAECADLWSLRLGEPFPGSYISWVARASLADGTRAVLKINFPDAESEHEGRALAHWDGRGAVRLLAEDPARRAMLVERCEPGTPLAALEDDDEATRIAAGVLRRLWRPAPPRHPFALLSAAAEFWAEELPAAWQHLGRPFERALLDAAVTAARDLGSSQGEPVVLHQDFHGGNVLRSSREPWLAVDPKPLVGEREFDAASLLRDRRDVLSGDPEAGRIVRRRLDQLADELDLERERMRGWGIVHALAWGVSAAVGKVEADMLACARWLAEA
jgi:streptomycin 6-kinase